MQNNSNEKPSEEVDKILQCDTLSTESPSNSDVSISPVNGDDNEKNTWVTNHHLNCRNKDEDDEERLNNYSLNDGIILSHIGGTVEVPRRHERQQILFAPSTIEERQNEKFARKVGIHL